MRILSGAFCEVGNVGDIIEWDQDSICLQSINLIAFELGSKFAYKAVDSGFEQFNRNFS